MRAGNSRASASRLTPESRAGALPRRAAEPTPRATARATRRARFALDVHVDARGLARALARDVRAGLTASPKTLPAKYFYDEAGSELFERITELPEYYPTRAEAEILERIVPNLMPALAPRDIVELGAGAGVKIRRFLDAAIASSGPLRYVPFDVDAKTTRAAARRLLHDYVPLRIHGVVGDFERHLSRVPPPEGRRLVLFLGSTIGNLDAPARLAMLREIRRLMRTGDRLLLGVDLVKDTGVLEAAYDDAAGVTAEFNRNVLRVINRALDADFRPEAFRHVAFYNDAESRIEMHLVPDTTQTVRVRRLGLTVTIAAGESIWTESSYKFTRASVTAMLADAGLPLREWYTDPGERFAVALAG
jgi:L-histidine N-alpha-methyltransferase